MKNKKMIRFFALLVIILVSLNIVGVMTKDKKQSVAPELSLNNFMKEVKEGKVKSAVLVESGNNPLEVKVLNKDETKYSFFTLNASGIKIVDTLNENKVSYITEPQEPVGFLTNLFFSWGPMILLIGIWIFVIKKMNSGGGPSMFGKSKAKLIDPEEISISFEDVVGCDEAKLEIEEFVEFLKNPEKFAKLGGRTPGGLLLTGPAGTGKAQPLYSNILMSNGWKPMGDMKQGDLVCNPDGGYSSVVGIFPQGIKDNYKITFSDDTVAESCDEHLWTVRFNELDKDYKTYTLKNIQEKMNEGYIATLYPITQIDCSEKNDQHDLFHSSYKERFSLFQTLMDNNGQPEKDGSASYCTHSLKFAEDFIDFARSLGFIAQFLKNNEELSLYKISILSADSSALFTLPSKKELAVATNVIPTKTIKSIEYLGKEEMQCIMLDSENKLYITDGYNPTHNTMLAKALAKKANVPFFAVSGSDFVEMFVGVGAARMRNTFEMVRKFSPCILFIDELDSVGGKRNSGGGMGGGSDEREQTLNQFLVELDGMESNKGFVLIGATNRPEVLDKALLRPGRIDRQIVVNLPDVFGRQEILKIHSKKVPLTTNVDLGKIARGTPGFSGAELANLINEAALFAARSDKKFVEQIDLEAAKDKIMMGVERPSLSMTEKAKKETAYHEAGHTIIAKILPNTDPVYKVTIIPRGRALGVTMQLPEQDRWSHDQEFLTNKIAILMGGRAAEEIFCKTFTNGASNDISVATDIATNMVTQWGMSDLGPVAFGNRSSNFLGEGGLDTSSLSQQTLHEVNLQIRTLINEQYLIAKKILQENKDIVEAMTNALVEIETIEDWQIENLIHRRPYNDPIGLETMKELSIKREQAIEDKRNKVKN